MGDPAPGVLHGIGELGHPERTVAGLREPDEDLVLRQGQIVVLTKITVEAIHE
jgi:hypothetical protein